MLLKPGVSLSDLKRPVRRELNKLDKYFWSKKDVLIIKSTNEGSHMPSSLHYADLAIDIGRPYPFEEYKIGEIIEMLGKNFDVVVEKDHIHIEFDPKE